MRTLHVQTATAKYDVLVGRKLLPALAKQLRRLFSDHAPGYFVVTTPEIWALWSEPFMASLTGAPVTVLFVPAGEGAKRLSTIERLAAELSTAGADRKSVLLAFGGGVIGDLTGFLAAVYMRGVAYIQIPTTFLSQVDSSVGGKTGVNLKTGKNLVGSFHHPRLVVADLDTLSTLPANEFRSGLFESIKAGLIRDRALLATTENDRDAILERDATTLEKVVAASIRMKAQVVGEDEHESSVRMILNFGHTLGHAIESSSGYGTLLHGEAVAWGMLAALHISRAHGLSQKDFARAVQIIHGYGLPDLPPITPKRLLAAAAGDKKNTTGNRRYVLLNKLGSAYVCPTVTDAEILAAIAYIQAGGTA